MMKKSALAGEGGGARPPPFTLFTITYKVAVSDLVERADTSPPFLISSTLYVLYEGEYTQLTLPDPNPSGSVQTRKLDSFPYNFSMECIS